MSVDPRLFRADVGPRQVHLYQSRCMSVDSSSMLDLNNFRPLYNVDETKYPRHFDLNEPADRLVE